MKVLEKSLWRWLANARKRSIHIERIENALSKSTPDVECSVGAGGFWIELKTAAAPVKPSTPVHFRFRPGQSVWLRRRWEVDRGAWLLVQVDRTKYLIRGEHAGVVESGLTVEDIADLAECSGNIGAVNLLKTASSYLKDIS